MKEMGIGDWGLGIGVWGFGGLGESHKTKKQNPQNQNPKKKKI